MVPILETTKYGQLIREYRHVQDVVLAYDLYYDILIDVAIDNTNRVQRHLHGDLGMCSVNGHYFMLKYARRTKA